MKTGSLNAIACAAELPADGPDSDGRQWVHILPAETVKLRDGRGPMFARDLNAIIANSLKWAGNCKMPVDYEHQLMHSPKNGKPAPAAGWIDALEARANGVWARVEWTPKARQHIADREYRYVSPVIHHTKTGDVIHISQVALVNEPAIDTLVSLFSREKTMNAPDAATMPIEGMKPSSMMRELRQLLGLSGEGDPTMAELLEAVRKLVASQDAANPDPSKFVPIADFEAAVAEANKLRQGVTATAASAHVELAIRQGQMPPFLRDWGVTLCQANKPAFDAFIERTGASVRKIFEPSGTSMVPPSAHGRTGLASDVEAEVAQRLGLSTEDYNAGRMANR